MGNLEQILRFCKLKFLLAFLVLFCVQVMQTNNNESSWKEKKKQISNADKQKMCKLVKEKKHSIEQI